jgi:hypothetical protein
MATTGRPAINTPRALDLRGIQNAINNIRERLEALDKAVAVDVSATLGQQLRSEISILRLSLITLTTRVSALETAADGDTITMIADEAISAGDPVVAVSSTRCAVANASDATLMSALIGVATTSAAENATVTIRILGAMTITGAAFDSGRAVYVGDTGLTQTPNYESAAVPVGVAVGATTLWVSPGWPSLVSIASSSIANPFTDYMPVTYGMLRPIIDVIEALLDQPNGVVVKVNDALDTRVLIAGSGSGIVITNPDGFAGDPRFDTE